MLTHLKILIKTVILLEKHMLLKPTQVQIKIFYGPASVKNKSLIRNFLQREFKGLTSIFFQIFKEVIISMLLNLFQRLQT